MICQTHCFSLHIDCNGEKKVFINYLNTFNKYLYLYSNMFKIKKGLRIQMTSIFFFKLRILKTYDKYTLTEKRL